MTAGVRVRTDGLVVRIDGIRVLDGVSIDLAPGTMTAIVGPSGSGKTTLFNVLAGLRAPSDGVLEIGSGRVALIHQAFALLSLLTAAENVELAGQILGRPRADVLAAAARCLDAVDMGPRADHLVEELSGGEQQRVAIARAMITEPQVLLADEATAQLDPVNRENVVEMLRRTADSGATVVLATHDPEVAARCDAVVALRSGRHDSHAATSGRHRSA